MSEQPSGAVMLGRGLTRRCPRCGQGHLFRRWFSMSASCPRCSLPFERGEGFWLGSMAINLGVTELVFGVLLVTGMVLTWPDIPVFELTVAAIIVNAVLPLVLYPFAKTTFLAVDQLMHRMDSIDRPSTRPGS